MPTMISSSNHLQREYRTVDCPALLRDTTNGTILHKRETTGEHPFWISLHSKEFDPGRWMIMERGQYYEFILEEIWEHLLSKANGDKLHVMDVGANIGYYSLLSASARSAITVDAFEPNPHNQRRLCESIHLNGWDGTETGNASINVFAYGLSNQTSQAMFVENRVNPGAGQFRTVDDGKASDANAKLDDALVSMLPVITLDDFAQNRGWLDAGSMMPRIEILKIDVEDHEAQVLLGARRLLQTQQVRNVFMELSQESRIHNLHLVKEALQILVDAGYRLVGEGKVRGPKNDVTWKEYRTTVPWIMAHLKRQKMPYLNLWWSLDHEEHRPSAIIGAR
eukprot:CAMPEP_0198123710 /NCGR_PEP_ID=MMETSP1442-20131203/38165_1 /TAXON_ID= /ORGANISM="Craspedostauros australis, Strain CCMP3328" /LENGTH=336 /DNA_ID=CAMNT_0043782955 /DNA_START=238 /DNA_END=1248 /DNA_ORIENTATION=-